MEVMRYMLDWTGINRDGVGSGGRVMSATPSELAEQLYNRRFRSAVITCEGVEVGRVGPHPRVETVRSNSRRR